MMLVNIHFCFRPALLCGALMVLLTTSSAMSQELTLKQCIDQALEQNRSIKISRIDVLIAEEKNSEAKSALFPKLNGIADYRYYSDLPYQFMPAEAFGGAPGTYKQVQFGTPQNMTLNAQLYVPVFQPAALSAINTTREAISLKELWQTKTEEEVVMEVSNVYYNAQILRHQLEFLDSNIINSRRLVRTASFLLQQQMAIQTDVDRLNLQLEQLISRRLTVLSQQQQALNALKFLIGQSLSDTLLISRKNTDYTITRYRKLTTVDLQLVDKQLDLNTSELKGLKHTRLPSLGVYGMVGTTGFGSTGSNSFFNFYPVSYFGAQMTIPLFSGLNTHRKIQQKKTERNKTLLQKELLIEKTGLDQANSLLQYQTAEQNLITTQTQINLANKIYHQTIIQSQEGIATVTDLIMADNALREAQQDYIVALITLKKAELNYKQSTGNLLTIN